MTQNPPRRKPKPMRVSHVAVAEAGPSMARDAAHPFVMPTPAPGVLPKSAKLAQDNAMQPLMDYAIVNAAFHEGVQFMGYPYLVELTQRPEYRRPAEIFAKQMTRKWIEIQSTGDDGEDKSDKIKQIKAEFTRLNVQATFRKAIEQDGFFGRSHIYLDMGVDFDDSELATPLTLTPQKVGRGDIKRLTVVEPMWVYPFVYNSTNPISPEFYKPSQWFVMNRTIHETRMLTFVSREVPDMLKPAYSFGGLSLSQMMKPYVDNWLRTRQSVSDLVHSFTTWVLKTDMSTILEGGGADDFFRRLQLFNRARDNHGVMAVNSDSEEFTNISAPISGLDKLQAQAQEQMASVSGIPLVYLTGITPSGLNATSEGEIQVFEDWCAAQQEHYSPLLTRLLKIVQLSLFGEIDEEISFRWMPLRTQTENELATARKTEAETDVMLIDAGVLFPQEVRERIAAEEDSPYATLDLNAELPEPMTETGHPGPDEEGLEEHENQPQLETDSTD